MESPGQTTVHLGDMWLLSQTSWKLQQKKNKKTNMSSFCTMNHTETWTIVTKLICMVFNWSKVSIKFLDTVFVSHCYCLFFIWFGTIQYIFFCINVGLSLYMSTKQCIAVFITDQMCLQFVTVSCVCKVHVCSNCQSLKKCLNHLMRDTYIFLLETWKHVYYAQSC